MGKYFLSDQGVAKLTKLIKSSINSVLSTLRTEISTKANSNHTHDTVYSKLDHTHSNYASSTHNHDTVYSKLNHTHDYAATSHTHDDRYYTETEINTKLSGKSDTTHNHDSVYSKTNHTHSNYAATNHGTHVTFSTTAPVVDGTASVGTATTVARSDHKHPTDTTRAAVNHNHDTVYSKLNHTHSYVPTSGGTLSGALNFSNNTWNCVGDDAAVGDRNVAGNLCVKGLNGTPGIRLFDQNDNVVGDVIHTGNVSTYLPFSFGVDTNGNYGYYKDGADTVTPFRTVPNSQNIWNYTAVPSSQWQVSVGYSSTSSLFSLGDRRYALLGTDKEITNGTTLSGKCNITTVSPSGGSGGSTDNWYLSRATGEDPIGLVFKTEEMINMAKIISEMFNAHWYSLRCDPSVYETGYFTRIKPYKYLTGQPMYLKTLVYDSVENKFLIIV